MITSQTDLKRKLTGLFAATLAMGTFIPAAFADVTATDVQGADNQSAIQEMMNLGIINPYTNDNTFRPTDKVTRGQFVSYIYTILSKEGLIQNYRPAKAMFKDVGNGIFCYNQVNTMAHAGFVKGLGNGSFGQGWTVPATFAAEVMLNVLKANNVDGTDYNADDTYAALNVARNLGLFDGTPQADDLQQYYMNRSETAQVLENLYVALKPDKFAGVATSLQATAASDTTTVGATDAITVAGQDPNGNAVDSVSGVQFKVVSDNASDASVTADGQFSATKPGNYTVRAFVDNGLVSNDVAITVTAAAGTVAFGTVSDVMVGAKEALTVNVQDDKGQPMTDPVAFSVDDSTKATLDNATVTPDAKGNAVVNLTGVATGTVTVTATVDGKTVTQKVNVVPAQLQATVSAPDLKEVIVKFNQAVDKTTAENISSYTINQGVGTAAITSAQLQADGQTVILTPTTALNNQETDYSLSINGVKAATGSQVLTGSNTAFTPVDNTAPTVVSVAGLGNKAVKITFSEPVKLNATAASTFKIDNVVASGTTSVSGRTVTLQLFNTLSAGSHTLNINGNVVDYANIQLAAGDQPFTVTADTTAPTIAGVSNATLEAVTVQFSKDVQPSQATATSNYYWLQGTTKHYPSSVTEVAPDTYTLNFATADRLPGYTTALYVSGISDWSGNTLASGASVNVTAQLDQTRPQILTGVYSSSASTMTLTFSKPVDSTTFKASNVAVTDSTGKTVSNGYTFTPSSDGKTVVVNFSNSLSAGTYTFAISGVTDTTLLANAITPYTTNFTVADTTAPTAGSTVTGAYPNYIITFSKAMDTTDTASILNPDNYYITYTTTADQTHSVVGKLPAGTNLAPTAGNKGVIITLPSGIHSVSSLTVQGVKDASGNFLSGFSKTYDLTNTGQFASTLNVKDAKATGHNTVVVEMNQPVGDVKASDFAVVSTKTSSPATYTVTGASVDPNNASYVDLTLASTTPLPSNAKDAGNIVNVDTITTPTGTDGVTGATLAGSQSKQIKDAIAPSVVSDANGKVTVGTAGSGVQFDTVNHKIIVTFDESVAIDNAVNLGQNFQLFEADGQALTFGKDFTFDAADSTSAGTPSAVVEFNVTPQANASALDKLGGYDGALRLVFDNSNGNITDTTGDHAFDSSSPMSTAANGFDTNSTASPASAFGEWDYKAPTVTSKLAGVQTINSTATASFVITFSKALDATSQTAVVTALNAVKTGAGTATYTWNATKDTLTVAETAGQNVVFTPATGGVTATISDALGNSNTGVVLISQ